MRRPIGFYARVIVVAAAIGCESLMEGGGFTGETATSSDGTTSSSVTSSATETMNGTSTTAATTAPTSTTLPDSDGTTTDTGDTTQPVITTDETSPTSTTNETTATTEPATSSTSSSTSGMSECDYLGGACGNCIDNECCVELMECEAGSMQCQQHLDCLVDGINPSECASDFDHPSTHDLAGCVAANCMPPCA